jgi:hypothetical protein
MGYFNIYGTIVNDYFSKYKGIDQTKTSIVGGTSNILAIVSCLVSSIIIDKFKNYRKIFFIFNAVGIVSHLCLTLGLELFEDYAFYVCIVSWTICSCSILPIYTCSMDFVCEITYPVGESIAGGVIMSFNQISGIIGVK